MSDLSRLNRLTYNLDIQYLGQPKVQTGGRTDRHRQNTHPQTESRTSPLLLTQEVKIPMCPIQNSVLEMHITM